MSADRKQISIIIPVYNVETYLEQCMESLCKDLPVASCEIILADDGSVDRSGSLCDVYAEKYDGISVIHQRHAGAAAARNAGIRRACGEYILFIDADDFIAEGALKRMEIELEDKADCYFLQIIKAYPDGQSKLLDDLDDRQLKKRDKMHCIRYLAGLAKFPGSACAKLVRRELIVSDRIFFEEGVTAEDLIWTLQCILHARTFRYLDFPFYYYRQMRAGSVTSEINVQSLADLRHAICRGMHLAGREEFRAYRHEISAMMAYEAEVWLLLYGSMDRAGRVMHGKSAKKLCRLLKYRRNKRTAGIRCLIKLLGVYRAAGILHSLRSIYARWEMSLQAHSRERRDSSGRIPFRCRYGHWHTRRTQETYF